MFPFCHVLFGYDIFLLSNAFHIVCIIKGIYIEEALCIFGFRIFMHRMYSMNYIFYLVYNVQFILCDV